MAENTLVIVESAAKAKTLGKFLGKGYKIKASVGHIKDLPKSKLGIDVNNDFEPQYITIRGKGGLLKEIKDEAQKADRILLATDPDREGEAIAWHLQNAMRIPAGAKCRIEFNEITRDAVKGAIKKARPVDANRVNAQQARRVLDRLVGYNLSPLLWSKVRKGLSAGRVQSVVVRLICEREKEIEQFQSEEYWTIEARLADQRGSTFLARLVNQGKGKIEIHNEAEKDNIVKALSRASFIVSRAERKERTRKTPPPFITSTLQQEASKRLNFYSKRTMKVAQELYEGLDLGREGTVGLITYLRTDSTRVAAVAQEEALAYISAHYGAQYAPSVPNQYKARKTAQDAHECIRPTSLERTPESIKGDLSRDQLRLYKLIWERFVASQMAAAIYDTVTVDISAGDYGFRATSSRIKFSGYLKVYNDDEDEINKNNLPELVQGQKLDLQGLEPEQHFTQPPPRYSEASLVKLLEENNIGRPSTYAPIIDTILKRNYVERQNKQFVPTELGFIVVDLLRDNFSNIVEVDFTARMEENLDQIEEGTMEWKKVIRDFYGPFAEDLERAAVLVEKVELKPEEAGKDCPQCGRPLLVKHGRFGKFLACSGFPECRHTESVNEEVGVKCPQCGGEVLALKSKKGRRFYGCANYPACDFRSWNKPSGQKCPVCGEALLEKVGRSAKGQLVCNNAECKYTEEMRE